MNNKLQRTDKSIAQVQQLSEPAQKAQVLWRTLATPKDFRQPNAIAPYNKENTHNKYRYNKYNKCRCKQQSNHIISYPYRNINMYVYTNIYCMYSLHPACCTLLPTTCCTLLLRLGLWWSTPVWTLWFVRCSGSGDLANSSSHLGYCIHTPMRSKSFRETNIFSQVNFNIFCLVPILLIFLPSSGMQYV